MLEELWAAVLSHRHAHGPQDADVIDVLVDHAQVPRAQAVAAAMVRQDSDLTHTADVIVDSFVRSGDAQAALGVLDHVDSAVRDKFARLVHHRLYRYSLSPDEVARHAAAGTLGDQDPAYDLVNHVSRLTRVGRVDDAWLLCASAASDALWEDHEHLKDDALFGDVLPALVAQERTEDALRLLGPLDQASLGAISPESGLPELAQLLVRRGGQTSLAALVAGIERDLAVGRDDWEFDLAGPDPVRTCLAVALCGLGRDDDAVAAAVAHEEASCAEAEQPGRVPEWEPIGRSLAVASRPDRVEQLVAERAPDEWNHLLLLSGALCGLAQTGQDWSATYDRARRLAAAGMPAQMIGLEHTRKVSHLVAVLVDIDAADTARGLLDTVSGDLETPSLVVDDRVQLAQTYADQNPEAAVAQLLIAWQAGGWPRGADVLAGIDEDMFVELVDRWQTSP